MLAQWEKESSMVALRQLGNAQESRLGARLLVPFWLCEIHAIRVLDADLHHLHTLPFGVDVNGCGEDLKVDQVIISEGCDWREGIFHVFGAFERKSIVGIGLD